MERFTSSRRQFLALASVGTGVSLAGCTDLMDSEPAATDDGPGTEGDGDERQATLFVEPDREALRQAQSNISQRVQSGELDQQEAQQEFMTAREEVIGQAVGNVESTLTDRAVSIDDRRESQGALLVSGPATGLIDLLSHDSVGGLVDATTFQEMQQQTDAQ